MGTYTQRAVAYIIRPPGWLVAPGVQPST